jgi:hypothetical protein
MRRDFGAEAQAAAQAHLAACQEALFLMEEEGDETAESPASAPFCGCEICIVREVLWATWAVLDDWVEDALEGRPRPPELRLLTDPAFRPNGSGGGEAS